ncbi:MAG: hypothetical protein RR406_00130 [Bacilli bacterium]
MKTTIKYTKQLINMTMLVKQYEMDRKECKVFRRTATCIKKDLKLDTEIIFVNSKDKKNFTSPNINGIYNDLTKRIIIFIDNKRSIDDIVYTIIHELTHAYQDKYMHDKYKKSLKELRSKKVSYKNSWHEKHANETAKRLSCNYNYIAA